MKKFAVLGMMVVLAGCAGRAHPDGSCLDPVCMKDGSVVWRQLPNSKGEYATAIAKKEFCPWNKPAAN